MPQPNEQVSAIELLAFLVIECGVRIDANDIQDLSPDDPLVAALYESWLMKQDREASRFALLASVTANVHGGKTKPSDFYKPQSMHNKIAKRKEDEAALRAKFLAHNARIKSQ